MIRHQAPAKINLGLRIVGRRADGYHLLDSVFAPLALADRVGVSVRESRLTEVSLALSDPSGQLAHDPDPENNLVVRAARAFLDAAGPRAVVEIALEKRIPAGAGLGGGSSDAAAVLRALDRHFSGALSTTRLASVALSLGADVPFFLDPRPAWVGGIGEEIEFFPSLPALDLVIAFPSPPLSTAAVFREFAIVHPKLTSSPPRFRIRAARQERAAALRRTLGSAGHHGASEEGESPLRNDLEEAAVALRPEIGDLRDTMRSLGARAAAMSGSGPSVYGVFESRDAACAAREWPGWKPETQVHVSGTLP